ncbi:hypothetical protein SPRG_07850 [Saprolegnia parasitica CBS 223.65]|uniref:Uncharacterized protein n=1 Tax=Saprolegnia parasitica (strain CBS 223.65) TaxID=695850 RepID=A0A067CK21_SAPPC|nr:hypothetical protein SPRG_07850 [Saprolegnia parasitica CBS 223.65]KDO27142.1 hypothetical protein SPRG_07850 [Saprolegnia parasitica CBS 223.65]|eukprot:XP_012202232.1 hypothetical protein SPRG_07850 [Saprolegnia parasitica CBS 223.65]
MVLYYAKRCATVWEKLGFRRVYVALEVLSDARVLIWVNSGDEYNTDQIVDAAWNQRCGLRLRLLDDGTVVKKHLLFDCQADMFYFLMELGMEPAQNGGKVRRGSFTNPILQSPKRKSSLRR